MIGRRRRPDERVAAWRRSRAETRRFFSELHGLQRRWDPLQHSFYRRWLGGQLSIGELRRYVGEYEHLVIARAAASARQIWVAILSARVTSSAPSRSITLASSTPSRYSITK